MNVTGDLKTVCFFGDYNPEYCRTKILLHGLRECGVHVIECRADPASRFGKYWELFKKYRDIRATCDVVIVGFSDTRWMPVFASLIEHKRTIFYDALFSFYDTYVFDRKRVRAGTLAARWFWFLDWLACSVVDCVLLDTDANINYFVKTFSIPRSKFARVFIGVDTDIFSPLPARQAHHDSFTVEYHGKYIPLQGVDTIIHAAKILEHEQAVRFILIGKGHDYARIRALAEELSLRNVTFVPFQPVEKLPEYIRDADVCIGIVGATSRANGAIPNKLYEAAAMRRLSINSDTDAINEVFEDGKNVVLIKGGNAEQLAERILFLKNNRDALKTMAESAYDTVMHMGIPRKIGERLLEVIKQRT